MGRRGVLGATMIDAYAVVDAIPKDYTDGGHGGGAVPLESGPYSDHALVAGNVSLKGVPNVHGGQRRCEGEKSHTVRSVEEDQC
jgi:hypothetical protein